MVSSRDALSRPQALARGLSTMIAVAAGLSVAIAAQPAVDATAPPAAGTPATFEVPQARTAFVLRRSLSADRVGVLGMTPEEGQFVTAGAVVARLKDDVPLAAVAAAAAKAESEAEIVAAAKLAESERLEATLMIKANKNSSPAHPPTYPLSDVERATLRADAADLQTAVKKHEKRLNELLRVQSEAELKTYHIVTPIDGIVTRVFRHAGEGVQQAEAILEVVNTTVIRVEGRVPAAVAARVSVGAPVRVRFEISPTPQSGPPAPAVELEGKIGFVDVSAEGVGEERYVRVWTELVNPRQLLRDGTPARMTIVLGSTLTVSDEPAEASSRAGSKPAN